MAIWKNSKVDPTILLKGDNFKIGRGLGRFWGNYFSKLDKRIKLYRNYKGWLQNDDIDEGHGRFLTNMVQHFPALFHELVGMNIGINESKIGFKASLFGLFTCWLAETDLSFEEYNGCSSVLLPIYLMISNICKCVGKFTLTTAITKDKKRLIRLMRTS